MTVLVHCDEPGSQDETNSVGKGPGLKKFEEPLL